MNTKSRISDVGSAQAERSIADYNDLENSCRQTQHVIEFSGESPLKNPRQFLTDSIRDLVSSKQAAYRLFRSHIAYRYRRSSLGLLWAFVPSLLMAAFVTLGQRAKLSGFSASSDVPAQFYAVFGLIMLQLFIEAFNTSRCLFMADRHLLLRYRTALEANFLRGMAENLFAFAVKIPILAGVALLCNVAPSYTLPLGLVGMIIVILMGTVCGLLVAPLNALLNDINHAAMALPLVLIGITPIVIETHRYSCFHAIYLCNPLAWIFDTIRALSYGHATAHDGVVLALTTAVTLSTLFISWMMCRLASPFVLERSL